MKNKLQTGKFLNFYVDISSTIDTVVLSSQNTSLYETLHYQFDDRKVLIFQNLVYGRQSWP